MESDNRMQTKFCAKNAIKRKILDIIVPVTGCISYEVFSVNITNPTRFREIFGTSSVIAADVLWFSAHVGLGIHLFRQSFFHAATTPWRITYSVFGTAMFNFGSVLMWGTTKTLLPKVPEGIKLIFGVGSGLLLLYIGWSLTDFLNKQVLAKKPAGSL